MEYMPAVIIKRWKVYGLKWDKVIDDFKTTQTIASQFY